MIDRFGLCLAAELRPYSPHGSTRYRSACGARHLNLGLVWRTGQAWICVLDLGRDRLRPIIDLAVLCRRPYAGSERAETLCGAEKKEYGAAILPRGTFELGARIRGHLLVASDIRAFDTVLSSMRHHQILCLACMLSVYLWLHVV